ncbi:MAG: acetyltransferase [Chitinophagaceae bacterium]|nr:acetyltransferase [Chitinophagaceae bacterium]
MKTKIILVGGGGHCLSVIGAIESCEEYEIAGILDKSIPVGEEVLGYPVVGDDSDIPAWVAKGAVFANGIGQLVDPSLRRNVFDLVKQHGGSMPVIIASTAWVSRHTEIGEGTIVFHKCIVNSKAIIGQNNIINTGAIIEHNTIVGDDNHISTGVTVNGDCNIGDRNFLGCGSIVHHRISIANEVIVGAGSVVLKDCPESGTYVGVPARKKK